MDAAVWPNVHPSLEYAAVVCSPHSKGDINLFEIGLLNGYMVVAGALKPTLGLFLPKIAALNLVSLLSNLGDSFFISFLHDIYHHRTSINFDHHFKFNSLLSTRSHRLSLCPPQSTINCRRYSFFVNTVFLWSELCTTTHPPQNLSCFTIYVSINYYFCILSLCLVLCCG